MDSHDSDMRLYYNQRSSYYDRVYSYPERQEDLRFLESYIPEQMENLDVLEIAAGTGYWSQFIIGSAKSLLATDVTENCLEHINTRQLPKPVETLVQDAYELDGLSNVYSAAFAGLWFSHIPKQRIADFLVNLHQKLVSGATVVFIDNSKAQCERLPIAHEDESGNTFQDRELDDGSIHRVLKNFPTENELMSATAGIGAKHKYIELDNFWLFQYTVQ